MDIKTMTLDELRELLKGWGQSGYRAEQLMIWLYRQRITDWDVISNVPAKLVARLRQEFTMSRLDLVKKTGAEDTTQKFLWRLHDGALIESVLIPASPALYGDPSDRHTLCLSTQVGCAYGCRFCASGLNGWKRDLTVSEIVEQVVATERWHARDVIEARGGLKPPPVPGGRSRIPFVHRLINNIVIMGMGEPLANYDNLLKALQIINAPWGCGVGARKITVSTSGLAPEIRRLAEEPYQFRLAVSLHGANDEIRNRVMPVNRKYPLEELIDACEYYQEMKGRMVTLEYILIAGVNDDLDQCVPLADLAWRLHAKINLIPYNPVEGLPWKRPDDQACEAFRSALDRLGARATLRREKGTDIDAACGQLRLKTERELAKPAEG